MSLLLLLLKMVMKIEMVVVMRMMVLLMMMIFAATSSSSCWFHNSQCNVSRVFVIVICYKSLFIYSILSNFKINKYI